MNVTYVESPSHRKVILHSISLFTLENNNIDIQRGKSFTAKVPLTRHMVIHTGDKPNYKNRHSLFSL